MYTGDAEFIKSVYDASVNYLNLWRIGENGLVEHRSGSWDWQDWGSRIDVAPLENAWYYYALTAVKNMAELLGNEADATEFESRLASLYDAYQSLWTGDGYKSPGNEGYDDRGNAVAVLSGLCPEENYAKAEEILFSIRNSSPYMEYYVLEALCRMGRYSLAERRMCERYAEMIDEDYSTLWENWIKKDGTSNHAWSGGPLVIMSRHIAGIRPLSAGYREFEIRPQYDLHNKISCVVPAVNGFIRFGYKSENGKTIINVEYPENSKMKLHLPENPVVTVNGKTVTADDTILNL